MIRKPAVAGRFYASNLIQLQRMLEGFVDPDPAPPDAVGVVVPHAGYMYWGHIAGAVYSRVRLPARNVVLCPNHTGYGVRLSIMKSGAWQTPLGDMQIDEELCEALMKADPQLEDDASAHRFEH